MTTFSTTHHAKRHSLQKFAHLILLALAIILASCEPAGTEDPQNNVKEDSELIQYNVKIAGDVGISQTPLDEARGTTDPGPTYFMIGVFEYNEDSTSTNPYTRPFQYASGGYSYLPENLTLSLFTNKKYIIQALAIKKSNGYGIAMDDYSWDGHTYNRLYLGHDVNTPWPAIICDSIAYQDPWLDTNSGVLLFMDGYMYDNADSTDVVYRGPLLMNSYYDTVMVDTHHEIDEIVIEPTRRVFGIQVNVDGLTDSNYVQLSVGRTQSVPVKISQSNNGETFVFAPNTFENEISVFTFKVTLVEIDESGNHISEILHREEYYPFEVLTKTVLDVSVGESSGRQSKAQINLKEADLSEGETISIGD